MRRPWLPELFLVAGPAAPLAAAPAADAANEPELQPGLHRPVGLRQLPGQVPADRPVRSPSNYCGNGGTMTLSAGYTGTVTASVSSAVSAEASLAIFAKVKSEINGTVSKSAAVTMTNTASFSVPAGRWGNAVYGRYRVVVTGESYQLQWGTCKKLSDVWVTYYVSGSNKPQGWCTWIGATSLGSRPAACYDGHGYLPKT